MKVQMWPTAAQQQCHPQRVQFLLLSLQWPPMASKCGTLCQHRGVNPSGGRVILRHHCHRNFRKIPYLLLSSQTTTSTTSMRSATITARTCRAATTRRRARTRRMDSGITSTTFTHVFLTSVTSLPSTLTFFSISDVRFKARVVVRLRRPQPRLQVPFCKFQ